MLQLRPKVLYLLLRLLFGLILIFFSQTSRVAYSGEIIVSDIGFEGPKRTPKVYLAPLSKSDAITTCPLETLPNDLGTAVSQLVTKVSDSVSKVKATQTLGCALLQQQLQSNQTNVATAIQNQFISGTISSTNTSQQQINFQTQQATAVNQLLLTTSGLLQRQCIQSIDDLVVVQRLVAQIATISGLFIGGWEGIAIAVGGQLLGNIPFFTNNIDEAVELFQKYDEINERGTFLCLYRQMQKTTCLLFARPEDKVIHGLDMTFKCGPTRITQESVSDLEQSQPILMTDVKSISKLVETSQAYIDLIEAPEALPKGALAAHQELINWCGKTTLTPLIASVSYPLELNTSIEELGKTCEELIPFKVPKRGLNDERMSQFLIENYWRLFSIRSYYQMVRNKENCDFGKAANTWESKRYFDNFRKSLDEYRNPITGNQRRDNYYSLVKNLGNSLATNSFDFIFKNNYQTFRETSYPSITKYIRLPHMRPVLSKRVRQRALIALIDLCKTMDPTLVCLYIDNAANNDLYYKWINKCVGPSSNLCQSVRNKEEEISLIQDVEYIAYFDSLCGTGN